MKCFNCGKDNKKGAKFCRFCGENLMEPEQPISLSFMLKSLLVIYVLIFCFYATYLTFEKPFQDFVYSIATK